MKKGMLKAIIYLGTLIAAPLFGMAVSERIPERVSSWLGYENRENYENHPGYNLQNWLDLLDEQIQENKDRANDCMRSNPIFQKLHLEEKDSSYIRYLLISLCTCHDTVQFAHQMNYQTEINRIQKTIETKTSCLINQLKQHAQRELENPQLDNETKKQLQFLEKNAANVARHLSENYNRCAQAANK